MRTLDSVVRAAGPPLSVHLLGRFRVLRGHEPIPDQAWARRKACLLFKLVALSPDRRRHKEQLQGLLWPDLDAAAANNNLHKALYFLRHILCPGADARSCPYVEFDGETVTLASHLVAGADVEEFEAAASEALASRDLARYEAAVALYAGDLLPEDLYEDWTIPRREALRQSYLTLLHRLGELQIARRGYGPAATALRRLLAAEPADEGAHCALMRAFALSGQRHQALRQYHLCREILARELNARPSPETVALYKAILAGEETPDAAPTPSTPIPPARYRLVGREAELAALLALLEQTAQTGPRLALVSGEAGVGKTRLAHEVARRASGAGFAVLAGDTYEPVGEGGESALPYSPLAQALRRFLADQPAGVRQRLVGAGQADLARLLPELGEALTSSALEPEAARRRIFDAVTGLLGRVAASRPALLLVDDLHAADQSTLDLLGYLLHQPPPFPVLVMAVARDDGMAAGQKLAPTPLASLLARAARRGILTRLALKPLTPVETARLVCDRLGDVVDEAVTTAVHGASEGNPLFAEQLLQAWQEESVLALQEGHWRLRPLDQPLPLSLDLRAAVGLRLGRLPADVQEVLALAAVAGREFPYTWLLAAGGCDEPTLLGLLDQAIQAGVLEEVVQQAGPLVYRFHHGLIRQTIYEDLSGARRRQLHWRLAEVLEGLEDATPGARAHHWFAAGRWPWAYCHALTAGDQALRAFAHAEALALYDRALAAARGGWTPSEDLLSRVHEGRARALMGLNRFGEAVTDLDWLADRARASGDRVAIGQALSKLATAHFWGHDLDSARRHAEQALEIARETGDALTATMCTSNLGCVALCTGHLEQGARHLETVLRRSQELEQPGLVVEALACLPGAYHWQGDSARSLPLLEEGISIAKREGLGFWLGNLLFFAGLAQGGLGHYEEALALFRQGQRHSQDAGDMFTAVRLANCLGWIHHELYDLTSAVSWDRQGVEMARSFPWPEPLANALVNLGFDHLLVGELGQAESCFAEATGLLERDEWMRWRWQTRLLLGHGELALARRQLERAEGYGRQALALAQETAARKNQARAYLLLGEIALAGASPDVAASVLQRAVALAEGVDNPRLRWKGLVALARAAQAQGDVSTAAEARVGAAQVALGIAAGLHDETLRQAFTGADPVRATLDAAAALHHNWARPTDAREGRPREG